MSPDTAALKRWTTVRAQACRAGVLAFRTDPLDGPPQFFTIRHAVPRHHESLDALESYIADPVQVRCAA